MSIDSWREFFGWRAVIHCGVLLGAFPGFALARAFFTVSEWIT